MKRLFPRALLCLVFLVLASGLSGEAAFAGDNHGCSCCSVNKCHGKAKCHDTAKACICRHMVTSSVFLPNRDIMPSIALVGYLAKNPDVGYLYLSSVDIFHPPKASFNPV